MRQPPPWDETCRQTSEQICLVKVQTWMLSATSVHYITLPADQRIAYTVDKHHFYITTKMGGSWQPIAEHKRAQRDALIPEDWRLPSLPSPEVINVTGVPRSCGLLSAQELDITENYDATALAYAISSGRLKSVDVTRAFCKASPCNAGKRAI